MMNEVLNMIDDLKKVKQKLVSGDTAGAIKLIDESVDGLSDSSAH